MMKQKHPIGRRVAQLALALGMAAVAGTSAQTFQKAYDDNFNFANCSQMVLSVPGGYVQAGYGMNWAGISTVILSKTDANGTLLWTKELRGFFPGMGSDDRVHAIRSVYFWGQLIGYVLVGSTREATGGRDILVIRTDANGNVAWRHTFGATDVEDVGYDIKTIPSQQVGDASDYIITGYMDAQPNDTRNQRIALLRLDPWGNLLWCRKYGFGTNPLISEENVGYSVEYLSQSEGFAITGYTNHSEASATNKVPFVIRTDNAGVIVWAFAYPLTQLDDNYGVGRHIIENGDRNLVVAGSVNQFTSTNHDAFLMEVNGNTGVVTWLHTYDCITAGTSSYNEYGFQVADLGNGEYALCGTTDYVNDADHVMLLHTTRNGAGVLWANKYTFRGVVNPLWWATSFLEPSVAMVHLGANGYILEGNASTTGLYLIKTDASGNSDGCEEPIPVSVGSIAPPRVSLPETGTGTNQIDLPFGQDDLAYDEAACQPALKPVLTSLNRESAGTTVRMAQSSVEVTLAGNSGDALTVEVVDMSGALLHSTHRTAAATTEQVSIPTANWPSGVYVVRITRNGIAESRQISVVK